MNVLHLRPSDEKMSVSAIEAAHRFLDLYDRCRWAHYESHFTGLCHSATVHEHHLRAANEALRSGAAYRGWYDLSSFDSLPGSLKARYLDVALKQGATALDFHVEFDKRGFAERFTGSDESWDSEYSNRTTANIRSALESELRREFGAVVPYWFTTVPNLGTGRRPHVRGSIGVPSYEVTRVNRVLASLATPLAQIRVTEPLALVSWAKSAGYLVDACEGLYLKPFVAASIELQTAAREFMNWMAEQGREVARARKKAKVAARRVAA